MHAPASPTFNLHTVIHGEAQGPLLYSDTPLSFWGGVNPLSGEIIDRHHPLSGQSLQGKILALPKGRGSCTGSSVLLELILNGQGPAALVLGEPDEILILGALIAAKVFGKTLPVALAAGDDYVRLADTRRLSLTPTGQAAFTTPSLTLSEADQAMLSGAQGPARQLAMQILVEMAQIQGAEMLIDITQAHIDGCIYTGPGGLLFAERLRDLGGKVAVPTTLNAISVDRHRWRAQGIDAGFGVPAEALAQAYVDMGASPSYTCAPYLLDSAPKFGERIGWAESNAVAYANSVLGARTAKNADFLDICIALTGRAPLAGALLQQNRYATLHIHLPQIGEVDDSFYPLLGHHIGDMCGPHVPLISGLEAHNPGPDDLKAFAAAFATTSSAAMFHIHKITPEAASVEAALGGIAPHSTIHIHPEELRQSWHHLNTARQGRVDLVALGNPHLSLSEIRKIAALVAGRARHDQTVLALTLGRAVYAAAEAEGLIATLTGFGAQIITDTCWCMIEAPLIPPKAEYIMTNSGKYAHYAPGLTGCTMHFGTLAACIEAACTGLASPIEPARHQAVKR